MDSFLIWHKWSLSIEGVSRVTFLSESENLNFWQIFEIFWPWPWKKKSSVLNWFFPYLAQMITSKRRCVAYNDLWPWPISSRSFGLGLENRVRSVASTVLDGFFPYLIQMITSMRREGVSHVITFDLDLYLQGHSTLTLKIVYTL